jgi:hypothetical protein
MSNVKISDLPISNDITPDDLLVIVDDPSGSATTKNLLVSTLITSINDTLPVKDIVGGTDISVSNMNGIYTINSTVGSGLAPESHTHDDRYYTKTEIDDRLALLNGPVVKKFTLQGFTPNDSTPETSTPFPLKQVDYDIIGVPVAPGRAMAGTITIVAVNNSTGNAAMSRFVRHFSIKNIDGTTSLTESNGVVTIGVDQKEDDNHAIIIKANNVLDRLDIEVSSSSCARWFAVVEAVEIDHTFATELCSIICCLHETTFDCETLEWGPILPIADSTQTVTDSDLIGTYTENGCTATVLVPCDNTPEELGIFKPDFFPTQCCALPMLLVADKSEYSVLCCGDIGSVCPDCSPSNLGACNPTGFTAEADVFRCPPDTIATESGFVVAPLTAQRLVGYPEEEGTNTATCYANTGTMTDRVSVLANDELVVASDNGTITAPVDPGTTSLEVRVEKCWLQNNLNGFVCNQGTDYAVSAEIDLLVYANSAPLSDGENNLPPDSIVDINF